MWPDQIAVAYYLLDNATYSLNPYSILFSLAQYNQTILSANLTGNLTVDGLMYGSAEPVWSNFTNTLTTNFSLYPSWDNLENVTIGRPGVGVINFSENVTLSGLDLNRNVLILPNSIYVNPATGLNRKAVLTLFNLSYAKRPVILKNGEPCPDCGILGWDGASLVFNVTGFSNYTTYANAEFSVSAGNGINSRLVVNQSLTFNASYLNTSSGEGISDATCTLITDQDGALGMTYSPSQFNATRLFTTPYRGHWYNITCSQSSYESYSAKNYLWIKSNETNFNQTSYELMGVEDSSIIVDSSENLQIVYVGWNNTDDIISNIYTLTNSTFRFNGSLIGVYWGAIGMIDYNQSGNLGILECGAYGTSINSLCKLYKK
ncbi:MAG TPA: hypothetical protein PL033_14390 [Candidatus Brocadiia bacterium]|nr:hypothetical protein [Candidatus Brocadiia bacterium]